MRLGDAVGHLRRPRSRPRRRWRLDVLLARCRPRRRTCGWSCRRPCRPAPVAWRRSPSPSVRRSTARRPSVAVGGRRSASSSSPPHAASGDRGEGGDGRGERGGCGGSGAWAHAYLARRTFATRERSPAASAAPNLAPMQGLMQDVPLSITTLFERAEQNFGHKGVVTATAAGRERVDLRRLGASARDASAAPSTRSASRPTAGSPRSPGTRPATSSCTSPRRAPGGCCTRSTSACSPSS